MRWIFSSITRISQIETQARKGAFRTVNLVEIASEVAELYDAAAEQDGLPKERSYFHGERSIEARKISNSQSTCVTRG
jgi:hypothetical protein